MKRRLARIAAAVLALAAAYFSGWLIGGYDALFRTYPPKTLERVVTFLSAERKVPFRLQGFSETTGREAVPCQGPGRTAVILAFGQSNAGNRGGDGDERVADLRVVNFNILDGRCYRASDPLLGNVGGGASVWTRVADGLVKAGKYDRVVLVPFAVGGSKVSDWAPGGRLEYRLRAVLAETDRAGLKPTLLLWHQGEQDGIDQTTEEAYTAAFGTMLGVIRREGIGAPLVIAQASICRTPPWEPVRQAQRKVASGADGVLPGPDSDTLIGPENRPDWCHLRGPGMDRHAKLWLDVLR